MLVLTTYDDNETVHEAVTAGAAGFALKDSSAEDLHRAVNEIAQRQRLDRLHRGAAAARDVR